MANYYCDATNGSDSNNGSSWSLAVKTFGALCGKMTANADYGFIASGKYNAGNITFNSAGAWRYLIGIGDVLIDSSGFGFCFRPSAANWEYMVLVNLKFTGWESYWNEDNHTRYYAANCCWWQQGSKYQAKKLLNWSNIDQMYVTGCTFWGLAGWSDGNPVTFYARNCIFKNNTTYTNFTLGAGYNNASDNSTPRGTDGWDTATYPCPFKSESTTQPDLSFNNGHAQFVKYTSGGQDGRRVGATFATGFIFDSTLNTLNANSNVIDLGTTCVAYGGGWQNDPSYFDPSWGNITITHDSNDKIDFKESSGGSELTAEVAAGTYTSGATFASAVQTALNNAPGKSNTYTVTWVSNTLRLRIASNGAYLDLLWASGTNSSISADTACGFSADCTGATSYDGPNPLCVGVGAGAPSDATFAIWNSTGKFWTLDTTVLTSAKSCRVISPVMDFRSQFKLDHLGSLAKILEGNGEIDNSQSTSTRTLEVRAHNQSFSATAASGTTTLDWTSVNVNEGLSLAAYRYWQVRAVPRLDKTA